MSESLLLEAKRKPKFNFPGPRHSGRPKEMLISFPSSQGVRVPGRGHMGGVFSLGLFSIHFMTCNKGGLGK